MLRSRSKFLRRETLVVVTCGCHTSFTLLEQLTHTVTGRDTKHKYCACGRERGYYDEILREDSFSTYTSPRSAYIFLIECSSRNGLRILMCLSCIGKGTKTEKEAEAVRESAAFIAAAAALSLSSLRTNSILPHVKISTTKQYATSSNSPLALQAIWYESFISSTG